MEDLGVLNVEENLKRFLLILLVALSVSTFSQLASWSRRIPYTLLLVIAGLALAFAEVRLVELSPELILLVFLPPLLFQAAWNLEWKNLKRDWIPVTLFAVIGVIISVAGTTIALVHFAGASLAVALLLGASLSATDPVSVVALFHELGASKRLSTLVDGESLFNDGVAVVAFGLLVHYSQGDA
jgi:monovalent cation:H+ antiporter, CPA1 family